MREAATPSCSILTEGTEYAGFLAIIVTPQGAEDFDLHVVIRHEGRVMAEAPVRTFRRCRRS